MPIAHRVATALALATLSFTVAAAQVEEIVIDAPLAEEVGQVSLEGGFTLVAHPTEPDTLLFGSTTGVQTIGVEDDGDEVTFNVADDVLFEGSEIGPMAASPETGLVAAMLYGSERGVHVFDAATGDEVGSFDAFEGNAINLQFNPDGTLLAFDTLDGEQATLVVLDVPSLEPRFEVEIATGTQRWVFGPEDAWVMQAQADLVYYDLESGDELDPVYNIAELVALSEDLFVPAGLSANPDGTQWAAVDALASAITLLNVEADDVELVGSTPVPTSVLTDLYWNRTGTHVVAVPFAGNIVVYDAAALEPVVQVDAFIESLPPLGGVVLSDDAGLLFVAAPLLYDGGPGVYAYRVPGA